MGFNTTHRCGSDCDVSSCNLGFFERFFLFYGTIPEVRFMKKRVFCSFLSLTLLVAPPAWGQTTIIKRQAAKKAETSSSKLGIVKKDGLLYEVAPWNNYVALVQDYNEKAPSLKGKITIPEYITYANRNYPVKCISRSFPNEVSSIFVPAQVENIYGLIYGSPWVHWEEIEVDSRNPYFSSWGNALFNKQMTELLRVGKVNDFEIPSSVTKISDHAFKFSQMKSVTIPFSVNVIGREAFYCCYSLVQISVPSSVKAIGNETFYGDSALVEVTLPKTIEEFGYNVFRGCSKLKSLILPKGIKQIKGYDFANCQSLIEIFIPNGVTKIAYYSFYECRNLEKVSIPADLLDGIEKGAFSFCDKLVSISVRYPDGTTKDIAIRNEWK